MPEFGTTPAPPVDPPEPPMFECPDCGASYEFEEDAAECCPTYNCPECGEDYQTEEGARDCCRRGGDPWYPSIPPLSPYSITVPALPNRPGRLLSIEQELTGGGAAVAQALYDHDLGDSNDIESYSYQPSSGGIAVCEDGSLPEDGGEVKFSKFLLSSPGNVETLSRAVGVIRHLHKTAGIVAVGSSAGMHIHGAAKDTNGTVLEPQNMAALHELFSFGEDMIFGLAAAGWRYHRYDEDNDYAAPIRKISGKKSGWKVAQAMDGRYNSLNFERLLQTVNRCACGSVKYGAWSECECGAFDAATVEWRVFNTSTKPETIHAWLLFVSAVTALAMTHQPGTLEDQPFKRGGSMDPDRIKARQNTLAWFLRKAPLTSDERTVIRDAAARSPYLTPTERS